MNATEFKLRQLAFREAELKEIIKVLQKINNGDGETVFHNSSRGEGQDLKNWKNRLDFAHMIVSGHSLGSNLAVGWSAIDATIQLTYFYQLQALKGAPSSDIPATGSIVFDP
jgi:platelet-activating factor acetylhydrolase